jgi:DNA-binding transcriptional LysR family regulator
LTSLTAFVRVVDSGGFAAAACRLNMSTTMVSNHIQALEDRLGARLLNRTARKVSLTEVGKAYYDRCTQILAEIEQADEVTRGAAVKASWHPANLHRHACRSVHRTSSCGIPQAVSGGQG